MNDYLEECAKEYNIPLQLLQDSNEDDDDEQNIPGYISGSKGDLFRIWTSLVRCQGFYTYEWMRGDIDLLQRIYPFMKVSSIGESVQGKSLVELKIGRGQRKIHMNASFHANEWITSAVLMKFVNDYLLALTNSKTFKGMEAMTLYENVTLSIVPMVNPDGVNLVVNGKHEEDEYGEQVKEMLKGTGGLSWWKANIRGVDLNNQFPAKWEVEKERKVPKTYAIRDYPGDIPLSEPEAIAMAQLAIREKFDMLLALHSQGKEIYWGYEGYEPDYAEDIVREMERVSGYKAIRTIDSHAGYRDWFIQEFGRPGFTIELGKGISPLPRSMFAEIYEEGSSILALSMEMWRVLD